ncbi:MAG: 30S ribosomal protein S8 [Candidatus Magasanikbacteria bacterium CG10_big_fil_rev_8_21_14_0_10_43_6]|uniref:Small ribosomal subunit protein uS8 n=1 Tax=Candidatus Magasanikbacteria bacterium CG10_big_fil_rev_8_21_14_0_10_43_6 TaxID=1974650 RepID=A0A2M6W044_9BACT|nr:MAG: 30S ribosomal protein S8 [Candidatus Magasanikbacteria bacterium CG10_big_fil_rev_8_21_14_0_10_43_6]
MTDPIADMLTQIRNAQMTGKRTVMMPASKLKKRLADILSKEGYLGTITEETAEMPAILVIELKYQSGKPRIQSIKRESKPGHRIYRKADELPRILNDYGIAIVSTSRGLMTNKEAREAGVGGELICSIY